MYEVRYMFSENFLLIYLNLCCYNISKSPNIYKVLEPSTEIGTNISTAIYSRIFHHLTNTKSYESAQRN